MSENNMNDTASINKKIEDLDNELNTFLETVKEIKEIRNSTGDIPEKLRQNQEKIENQKRELDSLISSARDLLSSISETKDRKPGLKDAPGENDRKLKELEQRLTDLFFRNLRRQKTVILIMLVFIMAVGGFSLFMFLAR